jgi:hypothetical protein
MHEFLGHVLFTLGRFEGFPESLIFLGIVSQVGDHLGQNLLGSGVALCAFFHVSAPFCYRESTFT